MEQRWTDGDYSGRQFARRLARRDPELARLLGIVAAEKGVPVGMLLARSRCRAEIAQARWLAMYLAHVALGRPIHALARLFRRNWSTVSRACMRLEDLRDRPEIDAFVERLERRLAATGANGNRIAAGSRHDAR